MPVSNDKFAIWASGGAMSFNVAFRISALMASHPVLDFLSADTIFTISLSSTGLRKMLLA